MRRRARRCINLLLAFWCGVTTILLFQAYPQVGEHPSSAYPVGVRPVSHRPHVPPLRVISPNTPDLDNRRAQDGTGRSVKTRVKTRDTDAARTPETGHHPELRGQENLAEGLARDVESPRTSRLSLSGNTTLGQKDLTAGRYTNVSSLGLHDGVPGDEQKVRQPDPEDESHGLKQTYDVQRVIYNRVPKCGSRTVTQVLQAAAKLNNFYKNTSTVYGSWLLRNEAEEKAFVDHIMSLKTPFVYDRHIQMVNFTRHGKEQPVFINVVREPVERLISNYHFVREEPTAREKLKPDVRNMTLDECVMTGKKNCIWPGLYSIYVRFFCGHDSICLEGSEAGLTQAKRNIIRHYPVIGLTEDLDTFFTLLEYSMPDLFKGTPEIYRQAGASMQQRTKTNSKQQVEEESRIRLMDNLSLDYDLYYFIQQRYHEQTKILNKIKRR